MAEHTPTPWEAQEFDPDDKCVPIIGLRAECPKGPTNGMVACTTLFPTEIDAIDGIGPERAIVNAAFIVKACNSHDALVKALEAACGYLLNAKIDLETGCPKATAIETIEGGLKLAREALRAVTERPAK